MITAEIIKKAYKKLKSSVYFDKTQLILRDEIVKFEIRNSNLDEYFENLADEINDPEKYAELTDNILDSISILSFPKKLEEDKYANSGIIINSPAKKIPIKDLQNFINMDVRGHILGVLWIMLIGYRIDKQIYEHSYGNRLRKQLLNELSDEPTYSPYLFEPYFRQYEGWRDTAMDEASKHLRLGQDVVIITMDFRRYYYSVDVNESAFEQIFKDAFMDENEPQEEQTYKQLNNFVSSVVKTYSQLFSTEEYFGRRFLPIGFLPSNVIANWYLKNFDKAIVDGWNPIYFGRYVDDVLIVDKVEHNSDIYQKAKKDEITSHDIIKYFLLQCSKWHGIEKSTDCKQSVENALLKEVSNNCYVINNKYNAILDSNSKIEVQNDKVKIFYFKNGETDALLTCFKENICKNKSEFRHMPEDEAVFQKDDYSEIYNLKNNDSPNKFRAIDGISIDKYELSKFIGKHLRIGGMIDDKIESKFEKDIHKIFNSRVIIENYILWEKIIEIFVINERFKTAQKFIENIVEAIEKLEYSNDEATISLFEIKSSLYIHLHSSICRAFSLVWNQECTEAINAIYSNLETYIGSCTDNIFSYSDGLRKERLKYCKTRMIDKSVMPIIIDMLSFKKISDQNANINLTKFYEVLSITKKKWENQYTYYPYLVTMYDFSMITSIEQLHSNTPFDKIDKIQENQILNYISCNYCLDEDNKYFEKMLSAQNMDIKVRDNKSVYQITVGDKKKHKLSIGIANVKLEHKNFELLIKGTPNRSYSRYYALSQLVNAAIDNHIDMLIMPESFVPYEWLSTLARTCAKCKLAVITGVEHIKYNDNIYNLTAVILPYYDNGHNCAYISFHLKTHYAPNEKSEIRGYRLKEIEGNNYELYKWNDCYFPVYCCYELASIYDRALFQSYADFLVAIEWNKDVNYYSNILESLSRDIHCYCIQVNSSDFGDSRITKPSKTEEKDIIRTKGGKNSTILIDTIDISKLRDFQLKEYELQKQDHSFKATPPDFKPGIILKKINGDELA